MTRPQNNSPSRELRIAHVDAETGFSGGEVQVFLLMEGLRALGHQNLILAPPASQALQRARDAGFEAAGVRMRSDLDLFSIPKLGLALRRWQPDLVPSAHGASDLGWGASPLAARACPRSRRVAWIGR